MSRTPASTAAGFWTRVLAVHPGEGRTLLLLGGHFLLLLAAMTTIDVVGKAFFLVHHPAAWIPITYIAGAVGSIAAGLAYGRISHRWPSRTATLAAMGVVIGTVLVLLLLAWTMPGVGAFAVYSLVPALGTVIGMESARLVTQGLDTRQARRLYPAISGIGGLGATAGSFGVAAWGKQVDTPMWLIVGALLFGAATVLALRVRPSDRVRRTPSRTRTAPASWGTMLRHPFSVALLVLVAMSGVASCGAKFLLGAAAQAHLPASDIKSYIGTVYVFLNGASMVFGFVLSRRLVARFGLGSTLLIYPLAMLILGAGGLMVPGLVMATAALMTERAFRQNVQKPLINVATMPLPPALAGRTTTAIRGAVEHPAVVGTSLFLLGTAAVLPWWTVFAMVLVAGGIALAAAWRVRRGYRQELEAALRTRRLQVTPAHVDPVPWREVLDAQARQLVVQRLESEDPAQAALACELLTGQVTLEIAQRIQARWPHWPAWVRAAALRALSVDPPREALSWIRALDPGEAPEVQAARYGIPGCTPAPTEVAHHLRQGDPLLARAAARHLARVDPDALDTVLARWEEASDPVWTAVSWEARAHRGRLEDDARIVARGATHPAAALAAMAHRALPELAPLACTWLADDRLGPAADRALARMGASGLDALRDAAAHPATAEAAWRHRLAAGAPRDRQAWWQTLTTRGPLGRAALRAGLSTGLAPTAPEEKALDATIRRAALDLRALRDVEAEPSDRAWAIEEAQDHLARLLTLRHPEVSWRRLHLALLSEEASERSFGLEALDESLRGSLREVVLSAVDPSRTAVPDDDAPSPATVGAAFGLAPPAPDEEDDLSAPAPLRGLPRSVRRALAEACVPASSAQPLRDAVHQADIAVHVIREREGRTASLPLPALWQVLAAHPRLGHRWLRAVGNAWLPPAGPQQADLSMSEASLASRPASADLEVGGDLGVWQRMFFLRLVPLFADLPPERLQRVAEICRLLQVPAGTRLVREGRAPGHAYVVCQGTFDVLQGGAPGPTLGPGESVGVLGLLTDRGHALSVTAREGGEVLAIDRVDFQDLVDTHPSLVRSLTRWIASAGPMDPGLAEKPGIF